MGRYRCAQLSLLSMLALVGALGNGALGQNANAPENPTTVLAEGDPPLTVELVDRTSGFIEWLLDVPLTDGQRQTIRDGLVESWTSNNREDVEGILDLLQLEAQVRELDEATRLALRAQVQPGLVQQLRDQPEDEGAQWLLAIYEAGHQPIADGDPPLTRQATDAYAEFLCFVIAQGLGQEGFEPPAEFKGEFAKTVAAGYADLSPEEKQELAQMPLAWAAVRIEWAKMPDEQKQQYRAQWSESVKGLVPEQPAEPAAEEPAPAGGGDNSPEGLAALQAKMRNQQMYFQTMSNIMQMQHETNMSIISNIGGGGWTYEYRY